MKGVPTEDIKQEFDDSFHLADSFVDILNNLVNLMRNEVKLMTSEGRVYTKELIDIALIRLLEGWTFYFGFLCLCAAALIGLKELLYDSYALSFLVMGVFLISIRPLIRFYGSVNERRKREHR